MIAAGSLSAGPVGLGTRSGLEELVRGSILLRWSMSAEIVPIGPLEIGPFETGPLETGPAASVAFGGLSFVGVGWLMDVCGSFADGGGGTGGCGGPDGWVDFEEGIFVGTLSLMLFKAIGVSSVVLPKRSIRF